jgi:hypothetical protein
MRNQKLIIMGAGAGMMISACSIFHSVKSSSQSHSRDSLVKTVAHEVSIDTGTVKTRETTDFVYESPAFSAKKLFPVDTKDLVKKLSTSLFRLDTAMVDVTVGYDTLSKTLNIDVHKRPEQASGHTEKTTEEKKGLSVKKDLDQKTQVKEKTATAQSEKKPDYSWILWLVKIVAALFLVLYIYKKVTTGGFLTGLFKRKQ